jgi:hypothetical protein
MKLKFRGNYAELQQAVARTDLEGFWHELKYGQQYRTIDGGILNWRQATGTITFQGDAAAREELKRAFIESNEEHIFGEGDGRRFYRVLKSLYPDDNSR